MLFLALSLSAVLLLLVYGAARKYGRGTYAPLKACMISIPVAIFFSAVALNVIFVALAGCRSVQSRAAAIATRNSGQAASPS